MLICSNKVTVCPKLEPEAVGLGSLPCHLDIPPPLSKGVAEIIAGNEHVS